MYIGFWNFFVLCLLNFGIKRCPLEIKFLDPPLQRPFVCHRTKTLSLKPDSHVHKISNSEYIILVLIRLIYRIIPLPSAWIHIKWIFGKGHSFSKYFWQNFKNTFRVCINCILSPCTLICVVDPELFIMAKLTYFFQM